MAPDTKVERTGHVKVKQQSAEDISAAEAALKARLSRKRTKTGCLTCRKRRIKCNEERPVCKNCVKSKRHCEGYNQRVVFKAPTYDYRPAPHGGAHITFQAGPVPGPVAPFQQPEPVPYPIDTAYYSQELRPRPADSFAQPVQQNGHSFVAAGQQHQSQPQHPQFLQYAAPPPPPPTVSQQSHPPAYAQPVSAPTTGSAFTAPMHQAMPQAQYSDASLQYQHANGSTQQHMSFMVAPPVMPVNGYHRLPDHAQTQHHGLQHDTGHATHMLTYNNGTAQVTPPSATSTRPFSMSRVPVSSATWTAETYTPRPELCRPIDYQPPLTITTQPQQHTTAMAPPPPQTVEQVTPEMYEYDIQLPPNHTPTQMLNDAAVEFQDDDYYDVDEEMDIDTSIALSNDYRRQQTLGRILNMNQISTHDMQMRRYDTFLYEGMLDKYRVEWVANPLRNPATARVFAHFVSVTGPSLSIFERHPRNTSVMFADGFIPRAQQGLWTYTLPMAALHHQGLLHAMLALASLHIARLLKASTTASMQHYAWALKRIHRCVSNPKKRLQVSTIAASMLLGFYEIIVADHMKWNTHLAGAKQLFVETDFAGMTRQFRRMKMDKAARDQLGRRTSFAENSHHTDELLDQIPDVDERVVSGFVGKEVRYGDHGRIETPHSSLPPELDLSKFEILKDLFWWYCKQDAYQSVVSGNHLLMDYSRWSNCPPRAPLGRADAVYGSFDHLILLLARIADFAAKDRPRKLRQMDLQGGQWIPPGVKLQRPPQGGPPPTPASATHPSGPPPGPPPNGGPMFFGMAPPPKSNVQMPSSYNPLHTPPTPQSARPQDPIDLHVATQNALEEYGRIRAALHHFSVSLGPDFQPLTPEFDIPVETPFGPALTYRSYDIGCLWAVYNMALIIAIRSHPHMHPAAHAAAAITARETAPYAEEIGRIAAGIVPGPPDKPLNPTLGSALCESCMPSFFAAVQYQSAEQRHATVMRIYGIAIRTGWGSTELIANGCETAWVKAGEAGRGPPYQRVVRPEQSDDPRLNGSWERLDPNAKPNKEDEYDRRLVHVKANARLNWAVGVMGTEDDVEKARIPT